MNHPAQSLRGAAQNTAVKPRAQTQVENQLTEIQSELERLDKAVACHAEKLQPVLRKEADCGSTDCESPDEILVPTADTLRTIRKKITLFALSIERLTERTEA